MASKARSPKVTNAHKSSGKKKRVSLEDRQAMIAEAAYLKAAERHFGGGDCMQDWLDAEREIDSRLSKS
jgi:hypothetical protein